MGRERVGAIQGVGADADALWGAEATVATFTGVDVGSPTIVVEDDVIDGHAATTFSNSDAEDGTWTMVTVVEVDDRWVQMWGTVRDDPHLIEQLESIRESIRVG
ncbi:hypothetical protein GCM10029992_16210 [Glycomyces albus]